MNAKKIIAEALVCVFLLVLLGVVAYATPAYKAHLQAEQAIAAANQSR